MHIWIKQFFTMQPKEMMNTIIFILCFYCFLFCFLSGSQTLKVQNFKRMHSEVTGHMLLVLLWLNFLLKCACLLWTQQFIIILCSPEQWKRKEWNRTQWWGSALFPFSLCHADHLTTCLPACHISISLCKLAKWCAIRILLNKKEKDVMLLQAQFFFCFVLFSWFAL